MESEFDLGLAEKTKDKVEKPRRYVVILMNDDYTTQEFVVEVLMVFFSKNAEEATVIMNNIHINGSGIAGIYSKDIAETKSYQVMEEARRADFPLMVNIEPED